MSNLREIKVAMPADFVSLFKETADSYGMTHRQLAAVCLALGYRSLSRVEGLPDSLPS